MTLEGEYTDYNEFMEGELGRGWRRQSKIANTINPGEAARLPKKEATT